MTNETKSKPAAADTAKAKPTTKSATVIALLSREQGATLEELMAVTGWQQHSVRAALTGLKKKGHEIAKESRDHVTCYRIAASA